LIYLKRRSILRIAFASAVPTTAEILMRAFLAALFAFAALAACGGGDYIIGTKTGTMIEATSTPYLDEATGMYMYRNKDGKEVSIRKEEVVQILER
jgi:Bacterial protein of unknown function (DUF903)